MLKRIGRWAVKGLAAISLLMFLAAAGVWARSYFARDDWGGGFFWSALKPSVASDWSVGLHSDSGELMIAGSHARYLFPMAPPATRFYFHHKSRGVSSHASWQFSFSHDYFEYPADRGIERKVGFFFIDLPLWVLLIPGGVIGIWIYAPRLRRRRVPGVCDVCGYDLRETPERCPECGTDVLRGRPAVMKKDTDAYLAAAAKLGRK